MRSTYSHKPVAAPRRRGSIVPLVAMMLLVLLGAAALVLDRTWLDTAQVEITTAAEAAALAAGRELAGDDLLRLNSDPQDRIEAAEAAAARVAALNIVAGEPVVLRTGEGGDVQIGRMAESSSTGDRLFLQGVRNPNLARVTAIRERSRGNPVALLLRGATGQPAGDATGIAEAIIDNHVLGVRAEENAPVPALPLAIRSDAWQQQIVARAGRDLWGIDAETGKVIPGGDGIPEILLTGPTAGDSAEQAAAVTMRLIRLRRSGEGSPLMRQITRGWSIGDLPGDDHEILPATQRVSAEALPALGTDACDALRAVSGQCRIVALYAPETAQNGQIDPARVRLTALVAGRVMQVVTLPNQPPQVVFQPGVIATRTAVTATEAGREMNDEQLARIRNTYIYELRLTR